VISFGRGTAACSASVSIPRMPKVITRYSMQIINIYRLFSL
jgi:hypothetical protein